jgi:hypothetical protein
VVSGSTPEGSFEEFAHTWLGSGATSLRGPVLAHHRSWCRGRLRDAALDHRKQALAEAVTALNRARTVAGLPLAELPALDRAAVLDAIDLFDEHLHVPTRPATPASGEQIETR